MPLIAKTSSRYLYWLGFIALFCVGFALWFLYDGTITYPRQRERAQTYEKLMKEGRGSEWAEVAGEHGWSTDDPGKPRSEVEIDAQLVYGAIAGVPGLFCVFVLLRVRGRWIELDETGLRTSRGRRVEFDQITTLDKKKWKTKGIARIGYRQGGRKRRLVLDDWKYDDAPTAAILREVEARIDPSQIIGGAPEPLDEEEPPHDEGPPQAEQAGDHEEA